MTKETIAVSFVRYMIDHAIMCKTDWCICKASTFRDMICGWKKLDKKYSREVDEVFEND